MHLKDWVSQVGRQIIVCILETQKSNTRKKRFHCISIFFRLLLSSPYRGRESTGPFRSWWWTGRGSAEKMRSGVGRGKARQPPEAAGYPGSPVFRGFFQVDFKSARLGSLCNAHFCKFHFRSKKILQTIT